MNKYRSILTVVVALSILIPAGSSLAAKVYTTDANEVPLRATPSNRGRTILMVPPSSTVELVYYHPYTKVFYQRPDGKVKEGWIATQFLSRLPPDSSSVKALGAENEALKTQLSQLENDNTGLSQKEKELTDKLNKLNEAYEELRSGSANYLKLKSEYDSAQAALAKAKGSMQSLLQENQDLKLYHKVQWFVAGAIVLLFGWFMGWISSRWRKKRRATYFF